MARRNRETAVNVFLGSDISLEGHLNFSGRARLDGAFKGSIQGDGNLLVGPSARIEAEINAAEVIVSGEIIGDVTATKRIELKSPGKLRGNICAPLVVMDEGVTFEGHCTMGVTEQKIIEGKKKVTLLAAGE